MSSQVKVDVLPDCDFCARENKKKIAVYDAATVYGPWANMCRAHFAQYGIGLGTGRGQQLILNVPSSKQKPASGGAVL